MVINNRDICMWESFIIDNASLIVYLIFMPQCPFGTRKKIADDPENPIMSINYLAVQDW